MDDIREDSRATSKPGVSTHLRGEHTFIQLWGFHGGN